MNKKRTIRNVEEDPRYHDTWKLIKRYDDAAFCLQQLCGFSGENS